MDKLLDGKVALVTGAPRGIGAAIARRLAAQGADGAVHYVKDAASPAATANTVRQLAVAARG